MIVGLHPTGLRVLELPNLKTEERTLETVAEASVCIGRGILTQLRKVPEQHSTMCHKRRAGHYDSPHCSRVKEATIYSGDLTSFGHLSYQGLSSINKRIGQSCVLTPFLYRIFNPETSKVFVSIICLQNK